MAQSNLHFKFTIAVNSNIENVWATLININTWHLWDTEIISATLIGDFEVGAMGVMVPKKGPKLKFYISELTPKVSYTVSIVMPIGELIISRNITQKGSQIEFTDDIKFTGFLKWVFASVLGGKFRKVLPQVLNNFKKIVEVK